MSLRKPAILFIAASATSIALGAEPIYTDPVGFVKLGNISGGTTPAVPANTDVHLAVPLENTLAFSGTVTTGDATTGTINVAVSADWSAGQWLPQAGIPFCAIITSGPENGLRGLVTGNGTNSLTVQATTPGLLDNLEAGDKVEIRRSWTLKEFFKDSQIPNNCQVLLFDETKTGINHSSAANYLFFAGDWYNATTGIQSNTLVLHPGELFILRSTTAVDKITVFGDVQQSAGRIDLTKDGSGAEDMEISHFHPVPKTVGSLQIPAEDNDQILTYNNLASIINKSSSKNLIYFGGSWYDATTGLDVTNNFELSPGQGFVFRRSPTSSSSPVEWIQAAP